METISRSYNIEKLVKKGQVLVIYGPRRSGKTTLVREYTKTLKMPFLFESGDNIVVQEVLGSGDQKRILDRVQGLSVYVIDEAQNVPNIGMGLKIIVDNRPDLIVIATGSSSFDLSNKIGEPLVGRREVITLYPFSYREISEGLLNYQVPDALERILQYGLYPQVYTAENSFEKESRLQELVEGYLLRDIFSLENIKAPTQLLHLVRLLAQYIGQPISATKLAGEININQKTVERYLDLLEKSFVVCRVMPFSEKISQSLKFKPKYYFYDIGIRNALVGNFQNMELRLDKGQIWENFCVIERMKMNAYNRNSHPQYFFYRSYYTKKEIDLIEQYNGIMAFECKWKYEKDTIALGEWDLVYPNSPITIIHKDNFRDFLC